MKHVYQLSTEMEENPYNLCLKACIKILPKLLLHSNYRMSNVTMECIHIFYCGQNVIYTKWLKLKKTGCRFPVTCHLMPREFI